MESFVVVNPGTDLTALGFGGCFAFVGQPNISILQFPAGGQSILTQTTPNAPSFMGIRLGAQTFAFASGFNAGGMVSSNGVTVTVGF